MKEYLFIHEFLGVIPQQRGFHWIWWCPGNKTEEGWEIYPEGITPTQEGRPSHYLRPRTEIANDLKNHWLDGWLANQRLKIASK